MERLALTRLLYFSDEVLYSLLHALVSKTSLEEAFFWLAEAYYSGFHDELVRHLWRIYYDFYAVTYPKYEKKITDLTYKWRQGEDKDDLTPLAYIVNMLFFSKATPTVFLLRITAGKSPRSIYTGKTPTWLAELGLPRRERQLIRSIDEANDENLAFYLTCPADRARQYEAIKAYFRERHGLAFREGKGLGGIPYGDKGHIALALVCHLREDIAAIRRNRIFRKLGDSAVAGLKEFNDHSVAPPRKTLPTKRLYPISPMVRCFELLQDTECSARSITPQELVWYHWEFFASRSPLWASRFEEYRASFDEDSMEIRFPDDDSLEAFYARYNYEPDEQSKEVQGLGLTLHTAGPALLEGWLISRFNCYAHIGRCPAY